MATVPPASATGDWRGTLATEDRKKVIDKIAGVLRDLNADPISSEPARLYSLANRFEDTVYKQATSITDYFHMIASRMVNLKVKNKKPGTVPGNPPGMPMNMGQPTMMNMGPQVINTPDMSSLKSMNMPVSQDSPTMNPSIHMSSGPTMVNTNMVNPMMKMQAMKQNQMMMQNANQQMGNMGNMQHMHNMGHMPPGYQNMPMQQGMMTNQMPTATMQQGPGSIPVQSAQNILQQKQTMSPQIVQMDNFGQKYWEKHASLQQYIKPLHTMIDQIDRLLKDYTGGQEKNLQQIKKKLEYMYDLLLETPNSRKSTCTYEEGLKVLEAAERQIQHWLQQLSVNKQHTTPTTGTTPKQPQQPQQPTMNIQAANMMGMNQIPTQKMQQMGKVGYNTGSGALMGQFQGSMLGSIPMNPQQQQQSQQQSLNLQQIAAMQSSLNHSPLMVPNNIPTPPHTSALSPAPVAPMLKVESGITIPHDEKVIPEVPNEDFVKEEEIKNPLQLFLAKTGRLDQGIGDPWRSQPPAYFPKDPKEVTAIYERLYRQNMVPMDTRQQQMSPVSPDMGMPGMMWWNQGQNMVNTGFVPEKMYQVFDNPQHPMMGQQQQQQVQQQQHAMMSAQSQGIVGPRMVNTVEKHVTVDNQEVIKKRKLNGNGNLNQQSQQSQQSQQQQQQQGQHAQQQSLQQQQHNLGQMGTNGSSTGNIMQEIREEVIRFSNNDSYFKSCVVDDFDLNTVVLEPTNPKTVPPVNLYITFEPDSEPSLLLDSICIIPIVAYGTADKRDRFPAYLDLFVKKKIREHGYAGFLGIYKQFIERSTTISMEIDQLEKRKMKFTRKETNDGKTILHCAVDSNVKIPDITVTIPFNYPDASPQFTIDNNLDLFVPGAKNKFENKIRLMTHPYSITTLLDCWATVIKDQLSNDSEPVNAEEFLNSIWNTE